MNGKIQAAAAPSYQPAPAAPALVSSPSEQKLSVEVQALVKELKGTAKRKESPPAETSLNELTPDVLKRFLEYPCPFKKYRDVAWHWVMQNDYGYFCFVIHKVLHKDSATYRVLSTLADPEDQNVKKLKKPRLIRSE